MSTSVMNFLRRPSKKDIAGLVDAKAGLVSPTIYTDPALYELELERVFRPSWLFLAHESQLKKTGDFINAYMAEDPVIVVRQKDGSFKGILNQCRHRGMRVCRTDSGNARAFTCAYHGWAYDIAGNLVSLPFEKHAYGEIDKSQWGLRLVPRVESYKGMIFGNWNEDAEPLVDHLGDLKYYIDAAIDRSPAGMEVYGGIFKWVVPANWKIAAEQSCSDTYHGFTTHNSFLIGMLTAPGSDPSAFPAPPFTGQQFSSPEHGHGAGFFTTPTLRETFQEGLAAEPVQGFDSQRERAVAKAHLGVDRANWTFLHSVAFPNCAIFDGACTIRVWHPRGPNEFEFWSIALVPVDADDATKEQLRLASLRGLGPAGYLEQDDGENWVEIQRVLRGHEARKTTFNVQMGLGRPKGGDPALPGNTDFVFSEQAARGFYGAWQRLMSDDSAAIPAPGGESDHDCEGA